MNVFFNQLFDYNFYCNKKLIETCLALDKVPRKSVELFSHILNAHHMWNARIMEKQADYGVFQVHDIKDWGDIHYENQRNSFEITTNAVDFEKRIDYENTEGRLYISNLQDILFHIINHSAHHRGQVSVDFRQNGIEPIPFDYINYKR